MKRLFGIKGSNLVLSSFSSFLETSANNINSKKLWELQFTKTELLHYCFKYYPRFKKGSANNSFKRKINEVKKTSPCEAPIN